MPESRKTPSREALRQTILALAGKAPPGERLRDAPLALEIVHQVERQLSAERTVKQELADRRARQRSLAVERGRRQSMEIPLSWKRALEAANAEFHRLAAELVPDYDRRAPDHFLQLVLGLRAVVPSLTRDELEELPWREMITYVRTAVKLKQPRGMETQQVETIIRKLEGLLAERSREGPVSEYHADDYYSIKEALADWGTGDRKRLDKALAAHPWIRVHRSGRKRRVHIADWAKFRRMKVDPDTFELLDVAPEVVEAYLVEAQRRRDRIDQKRGRPRR